MADEYKVKIKELPLLNSVDSLSLDTFMIAERGEVDSPTSKMQLSTLKAFLQQDDFDKITKSLKGGEKVSLTVDADSQQIIINVIDDGKLASKWYVGDAPTAANEGDCLLKDNGAVYRYDGEKWINTNINLIGPQGKQGDQGPQGENGENGLNGRAGAKGEDGEDGFSPYIVTMPLGEEGYSFTVINKDGSNEYVIRNGVDGKDGANGKDGKDGEKGSDGLTPTVTIDDETKHWIINGEDSGVRADPNPDDFFSFDKINDLSLVTEIDSDSNFLVMTDKKPYQIAFEALWKILGSFITVDTDSGLKQEWTEDNKLSIAISVPLADVILVDNETIFKKDDNSIYVAAATENTKGIVQPDNNTIVIKDGVISATAQTPEIATANVAGIVKPDGKSVKIKSDGTLYADIPEQVSVATLSKVGAVRPDGKTITIDDSGTISSIGGGGGANVDLATDESVGIVKPDNDTIKVDAEGTLFVVQPEDILDPVISELLVLKADNWNSNTQKVNCSIDILKQNIVAPTFSELLIWAGCEVYPQDEESDGIIFVCTTTPERDLTFKITSIGGNRQVLSFPYIYNGRETLNDEELLYSFDSQGHPILKEEIVIPASVASIDAGIFDKIYGSKTQKISLKKSSVMNSIATSAFAGNTALKEIDLSNATKKITIGATAFSGTTALEKVKVNSQYKVDLGKQAFLNAKFSNGMAQQIVNNSASIGDSAFQNCSEITDLVSNVCSDGSFASIPNLTSLEINMTTPSNVAISTICANNTKLTAVKINGITKLGSECFSGCTQLNNITLDPETNSLGNSCFSGCANLQTIDISKIISFGNSCFANCSSLSKIELADGVKTIPDSFLSGCSSITEIILPDSVIQINRNAFSGTKIKKMYYHLTSQQSNYSGTIFGGMMSLEEAGIIDDLADTISRTWGINADITNASYNISSKYTQNPPIKKWTEGRRLTINGQNNVWAGMYLLEELDIKYKFSGTVSYLTNTNQYNPFYFPLADSQLKTIHLPDDWSDNVIISNGGTNWTNVLTQECMVEMFNKLHDYTGSTQHTFTLGATNLARLTDEDKKIATDKNWKLA